MEAPAFLGGKVLDAQYCQGQREGKESPTEELQIFFFPLSRINIVLNGEGDKENLSQKTFTTNIFTKILQDIAKWKHRSR